MIRFWAERRASHSLLEAWAPDPCESEPISWEIELQDLIEKADFRIHRKSPEVEHKKHKHRICLISGYAQKLKQHSKWARLVDQQGTSQSNKPW